MATSAGSVSREQGRGWPERVMEIARAWKDSPPEAHRTLVSELWLLLNAALAQSLRQHSKRFGPVDSEDLRDIASQKSLDLLCSLDQEKWDPAATSAAQLCAFISTVARNGLVDHIRTIESKRSRNIDVPEEMEGGLGEESPAEVHPPDVVADRSRFAQALLDCAERLKPRPQAIWFFRVFYEMPAKEIARHPEVAMNPAAVDVTLMRCREKIRACMEAKGLDPRDMPPGTFVTLWETFRCRGGVDEKHGK